MIGFARIHLQGTGKRRCVINLRCQACHVLCSCSKKGVVFEYRMHRALCSHLPLSSDLWHELRSNRTAAEGGLNMVISSGDGRFRKTARWKKGCW